MALVSLRQVLDHAAEFGCGVPAFNVNNLEQVQAIMEAAQATQSPVILQASAGARKYAGEAGEEDGVDALAIAIGTSHGAYKFTRPPTGEILAIDRIAAIHKAIPNTHLVMHGSSSVPQVWLEIIRQYGGDIKET
jgi:fructose/tagatose bisphosphate aldolase